MAKASFSVPDYVVFSLMMLISAGIGLWYGCGPGGKQKTTREYLLADRQMKTWPVAVSLLVSFLSAIALLGVPSEIYTYGIQFCLSALSFIMSYTISALIFIPMFHRMNITCVNEYLEKRFSVGVRMVGCGLFILEYTLYLFVVLYAPSLALEAVAGLPLHMSILTTGAVCTFYTTLGGLKAVIWTDVFQAVIMLGGLILVAIVGTMEVGGFAEVWRINDNFGRLLFFDFNPDPTVRITFWSLTIGVTILNLPVWSISQVSVQRYLAMKTIKDAQRAVWMNIIGFLVMFTLCVLDGLVIFAVYSECDLKTEGLITTNDQVLPYFVVHKLAYMKGVPGMFTATLYAGGLSTASSALNAISLVVFEDIVKKKVKDLSDQDAAKFCKIIALTFGLVVIGGAFVVQYLGTLVLQLAFSIFGIIGGPLLAVFVLGMFVPRANYKGAYAGLIVGLAMALWVWGGSVAYSKGKQRASYSVRECLLFNETAANISGFDGIVHSKPIVYDEPIEKFYGMSFLWLCGFSFLIAFITGTAVSFITETEEDRKKTVNPVLLFPWREWLSSCLPGGKSFSWDLEENPNKMEEIEIAERVTCINWEKESTSSEDPS